MSFQFQKWIIQRKYLTIVLFPSFLSSQRLLRTLCLSRWLIMSPVINFYRRFSLFSDLVTPQWLLFWGFLMIFSWIWSWTRRRLLYCSIFLRLSIAYAMNYSFLNCVNVMVFSFLAKALVSSYHFPRHQRVGVPQNSLTLQLCLSLFIDDRWSRILEISYVCWWSTNLPQPAEGFALGVYLRKIHGRTHLLAALPPLFLDDDFILYVI
jgi:hypothetical protein